MRSWEIVRIDLSTWKAYHYRFMKSNNPEVIDLCCARWNGHSSKWELDNYYVAVELPPS